MKIFSALLFPFENNLVVHVTRGEGIFSAPQITRKYFVSYKSKNIDSFFYWYQVLQRLVEKKLFDEMKERNGK